MNNKIDYIEFPAKNTTVLKKFYTNCFGWKFTDYGDDYTSFDDGRITGGFDAGKKETAAKAPLIVIYSTDLEQIKSKIEQNGGKIAKDIYEFPGGKRFHFSDPDGNELAVWSDK